MRTERAAVALRYGTTPGYTGPLVGKTGSITVAEAAKAKVDPSALLLHPWFRREVITRKLKADKVWMGFRVCVSNNIVA